MKPHAVTVTLPCFESLQNVCSETVSPIKKTVSLEITLSSATSTNRNTDEVWWSQHPSPFGNCLVVTSSGALTHLGFPEPDEQLAWLSSIAASLPSKPQYLSGCRNSIIEALFFGQTPSEPLAIQLSGTTFQWKVWQVLMTIPLGSTESYSTLSKRMGHPQAWRACANAVGGNPLAWLIPCHRVLRLNGDIGGYRWGSQRKKAMLACEAQVCKYQ